MFNNRLVKIFLIACSIFVAQSALAVGASKVAVLDMRALINYTEFGKAAMQDLQKNKQYSEANAKLENLEAELKTMDDKFKTDSLTWDEAKKKEFQKKVNQKLAERQQIGMGLNQMAQVVEARIGETLKPLIGAALRDVVTTEGIDLVLDKQVAIYNGDNVDITPMLIPRLNKLVEQAKEAQKNAGDKAGKEKKQN